MTGAQHYSEAEKALTRADEETAPEWAAVRTAEAQVHATLALAAATAEQHEDGPWLVVR